MDSTHLDNPWGLVTLVVVISDIDLRGTLTGIDLSGTLTVPLWRIHVVGIATVQGKIVIRCIKI